MQMLRRREVVRRTGLSYPTIYRYERAGNFPARRRLGPNVVAWLDSEIDNWIKSRRAVAQPPASMTSAAT
jgi:prophage regulatory protein